MGGKKLKIAFGSKETELRVQDPEVNLAARFPSHGHNFGKDSGGAHPELRWAENNFGNDFLGEKSVAIYRHLVLSTPSKKFHDEEK
jgi:hypothetical protein